MAGWFGIDAILCYSVQKIHLIIQNLQALAPAIPINFAIIAGI